MGEIGADVHQVGDALAAAPFGETLEEFADLEEQHNEYSFLERCLRSRQEADAERSDSGYRHQEMFVEGIAVRDTLGRLLQGFVAYEQIRNEVDKEQLPGGEAAFPFDDDSCR